MNGIEEEVRTIQNNLKTHKPIKYSQKILNLVQCVLNYFLDERETRLKTHSQKYWKDSIRVQSQIISEFEEIIVLADTSEYDHSSCELFADKLDNFLNSIVAYDKWRSQSQPTVYKDQLSANEIKRLSFRSDSAVPISIKNKKVVKNYSHRASLNLESVESRRKKKLDLIFGDIAAKDADPWFVKTRINFSYIIVDEGNRVIAGTLTELIKYMTREYTLDIEMFTSFILTYPTFTDSRTLFKELVGRFEVMPPPNILMKEIPIWNEKKRDVIRLLVMKMMKMWVVQYLHDPEVIESDYEQFKALYSDVDNKIVQRAVQSLPKNVIFIKHRFLSLTEQSH